MPQTAIFADISAMDGSAKLLAIRQRKVFGATGNRNRGDNDMTYYKVEFLATEGVLPVKKFLTQEKAKKHARRVLGLTDDSGLVSKVAIVAVSRDGTPI